MEAICFYDGLSFVLSVVRQFFKLHRYCPLKENLEDTVIPSSRLCVLAHRPPVSWVVNYTSNRSLDKSSHRPSGNLPQRDQMGTRRVAFLSYFDTDESPATREAAGNSALISVVTIDKDSWLLRRHARCSYQSVGKHIWTRLPPNEKSSGGHKCQI